ncbi:hypothetical protein [Nocardiopsis sp. LOL_012]|uniref:hypothetical protein n=1 Tax=Nocardiopsis sp. LOL_012 TaxID=3345409 RepID=UPI003A8899C5
MTRHQPSGQLTLGDADPNHTIIRHQLTTQIGEAWDELETARKHATALGREYGANDRLARARLRFLILLNRAPDPAELAMAYRHGWLEGIEHLAPPNPARTTAEPALDPVILRAIAYAEETSTP